MRPVAVPVSSNGIEGDPTLRKKSDRRMDGCSVSKFSERVDESGSHKNSGKWRANYRIGQPQLTYEKSYVQIERVMLPFRNRGEDVGIVLIYSLLEQSIARHFSSFFHGAQFRPYNIRCDASHSSRGVKSAIRTGLNARWVPYHLSCAF